MTKLRAGILGVCCGLCLTALANAQEPAASPRFPERPAPALTEGPVRLLEPDTFLLPDKDGELQTVLRFPFEDFIEAVKLKHQIDGPERQPRYSLQTLAITGRAGPDYAELEIQVTILVRSAGWVRVPLGLSQVVLREPVTYTGDGEQFLHFDQQQDGYVSWLRSATGTSHQLTLKTLVPLVKLGGETSLELSTPRATSSQFQIHVETPQAIGRLVDRAQPLASEFEANQTKFSGLGLGGEFALAWRAGDRPAAQVPTALEATGVILARIDGRSVRSEARLTVRSFGGEFEQFRVKLPPGAELVVGNQPGYTLAPVEMANEGDGRNVERLVEVKLDKKTVGPVEVRLVTEQSRALAGEAREVELAGFEVLGAIRQWGHLAVEVVGDWQVAWGVKRNMRQVEDLPETLRRGDLVAGFEYFTQPCSLLAQVSPRTTRVRVEPEFVLLVGARQAFLEGRLKYTVRGAKVFSFEVKLPGWEVETVGPANIVDVDAVVANDEGQVVLPLLQPTTGEIELTLRARRELPQPADKVVLTLPTPLASSQTPSTVVVLADDNVELTPLPGDLAGLTSMQIAPRVKLPPRQQPPLFYRGEADPAVFAATLTVHPQAIEVSAATVVQVAETGGRVDQAFSYRVDYEPIDKLTLAVPPSLAGSEQLVVMCDGQPLALALVTDGAAPAEPGGEAPLPMRVLLPQPRIGACELTVSYPLGVLEMQPQQSRALVVPLIMPVEGRLARNEVIVQPALGMRVSHRLGTWTVAELSASNGSPRDLSLRHEQRAADLPLAVQLEERLSPGSTVVYRAWLQTWLTATARQDRVSYRFASNEEALTIVLPTGVEPAGVEVVLDGVFVAATTGPDGALRIPLPSLSGGRRRQLELRYNFVGRGQALGKLSLAAPQLSGGVLIENFYWQLILPRHEHLIASPTNLIPEFQWGWRDWYWGRHPLRSQSQLEAWVGASAGTQPPPATTQYLFSALSVPQRLELRTASRAAIVLFASGAVLVGGLLLLYVPAAREPGVLFAAVVGLLAVGLLYPEPVLLAAQAAVFGVVLVVVAGVLKRMLGRRRPKVHVSAGSSLIHGGRSTAAAAHVDLPPASTPSSATSTVALYSSESNG